MELFVQIDVGTTSPDFTILLIFLFPIIMMCSLIVKGRSLPAANTNIKPIHVH